MFGGLEKKNPPFCGQEFTVAVAAACGLGEGVEAAFGAIDDGKADIDSCFDELGGDEDDGLPIFAKLLGLIQHGDDVCRAHPRGKVEGVGSPAEFFEKGLCGFGGVEDEETASLGMIEDMGNEIVVASGTDVFAGDAFEGLEK